MHSHHHHREHQVGHRRVHHILKHEPAGAKQHNDSHAFSKVTSKTAAEHHNDHVHGKKAPKRYARGGRTKGHKGQQTNIAIVMPHKGGTPAGAPMMPPGAGGPGGPPAPLPGGPPGAPPGMPPGAPPMMRARGGRTIGGDASPENIKQWSKRASDNSYFRGGAATGVGREEKAAHIKRRKK